MQKVIHSFERPEEPYERSVQMRRRSPVVPEVAIPKVVSDCHDGRAHGTVFVCSLCPRRQALAVNPNGETHTLQCAARKKRGKPTKLSQLSLPH